MNKRQHIALTEAQIIAAEKGEIQLEYRNGEKVCQVVWLKIPYTQTYNPVMSMTVYGNIFNHSLSGKCSNHSSYDLFVSEPTEQPNDFMKVGEHKTIEGIEYVVCEDEERGECIGCDLSADKCTELNLKCCETILKLVSEPTEQVPSKPLYEVGEIIEVGEIDCKTYDIDWLDAELRDFRDGVVVVWINNNYDIFGEGNHRKRQKTRIYISGQISGLVYEVAYSLFEAAENELITKGYEVVNPMKAVTYSKDWSWFDYLSADIKLMEKCTHIYMLSNWRESGGASVEHEAAKWNNFTIIYQ